MFDGKKQLKCQLMGNLLLFGFRVGFVKGRDSMYILIIR